MEEYLVIARKYRPQQFNEIIGQEHVCATLVNAIKTGRVAHAYIFSGPKGIGKTTIARILAKALNCAEGPTTTPCDRCTPCQEITKGMNMDVMEIDGASNRGIDQIRELRENVRLAASGSRFKVYIIDEVHMLTTEAFNALLKTLEEPPGHVKFFFATTEPNKVPATIMSRCQRFELHRLKNIQIVDRLKDIANRERIKIQPETLYTIARCANGSMRDAESTLDKLIAYSGTDINHDEALTILGVVDKDVLFSISSAIIGSNIDKALGIITNIFEQGKDLGQFLLDLVNHFRDILLAKYSPEVHKLIELPEDDITKIIELSKNFTQTQLLEIINTLIQLQGELKWSLSKRITLEVGIIKILRMGHKLELDQLVDRLEVLEKRLQGKEEEPVATTKNPASLEHPQLFNGVKEFWTEILIGIGKRNPVLRTYLAEGTPMELKDDTLIIGFAPSCSLHQESLSKPQNKEIVEQKFAERLGAPIKLNFNIVDSLEKSKPVRAIDNPLVEKVRQKFGAKIVTIKSK